MKPSSPLRTFIVLLIIATPLLYLAIAWDHIPPIVPVHYNYKMQADRLAPKSELWIAVLVLAGTSLLVYVVLRNAHKIDPRRFANTSPAAYRRMGTAVAAGISMLNLLLLMISASNGRLSPWLLLPVIGLLFTLIGNYLPALKPNYWAGYRLPWIMNNEYNWRKTHQLAGKCWFWGGLLFMFTSLVLPLATALPVLGGIFLLMMFIPVIYSLRIRQEQKNLNA